MKIPLSPRLSICRNFVAQGERVADIGCDHGYLGISLLKDNIAASVIAADINEMPLQCAMRNALKFGVRDKMTFYLSDGVRNIPRDFDTLICAGMGADTMISILDSARWLKCDKYRLILQCQSKTPTLRQYLSDNGWRIAKEAVVRDGRFLYTVMEVIYQPGYTLTPGQCYFPPALLENPTSEVSAYYQWVIKGLQLSARTPEKQQLLNELLALAKNPNFYWLEENNDNCK